MRQKFLQGSVPRQLIDPAQLAYRLQCVVANASALLGMSAVGRMSATNSNRFLRTKSLACEPAYLVSESLRCHAKLVNERATRSPAQKASE
jgi:hypothetical protein